MHNSQYSLRGLLIVIGAVAALVPLFLYTLPDDPFSGRSFDRKIWLEFADDYVDDNPRASMIRDLQKEHLQVGMSRTEIIELLGEPETKFENSDFSYIVGMWSGFRMDHDGLELYFDQNGNLTDSARVQY